MRPQVKMLYDYFRQHPARVIEKAELFDLLWGHDRNGGPEWAPSCVNIMVSSLRKSLAAASDERLHTVHGVGYVYETGTCTLGTLSEWVCGGDFFTRKEHEIMRLLLRSGTVSYEQLRLVLWGDTEARTHHLGTLILFLRRKLQSVGYGIEVIRGEAIRLVRLEEEAEHHGYGRNGGLAADCAA